MKSFNKVLCAGAAVSSLALIGAVCAPKLVAAVRATLVEIVVPSNPYFGLMTLNGTASQSVGPGTGTLGVTQFVLTNTGTVVAQVNIYAALLTSGTCAGTNNIGAGTNPFLIVRVPASSTVVVPAPSPIVFAPATGYDNMPHTCVAAGMPITGNTNDVYVSVNGFVD